MAEYIGITKPLQVVDGNYASLDAKYGPYDSINHATSSIPIAVRRVGLTVGIIFLEGTVETVKDYWWKKGIGNANLELKVDSAASTKTSQLLNDANFQNGNQVSASLQAQRNILDAVDANLQNQINTHSSQINTHSSQIQDIVNTYIDNKGYFATLASLQASYPTPEAGDTAYVANALSSTDYYIYNVVGGIWTASTVEAPPVEVPLNDYALNGGSTKTAQDLDNDLIELQNKVTTDFYNITEKVELSEGTYYTINSAIAAVPSNIRKLGLILRWLSATKEIETLKITNAVTADGNVTITLNGVSTDIAVIIGDTDIQVANKIRATNFAGWITGGAVNSQTVTFTCETVGNKLTPTYKDNGTGALGEINPTTIGYNRTWNELQYVGNNITDWNTLTNWNNPNQIKDVYNLQKTILIMELYEVDLQQFGIIPGSFSKDADGHYTTEQYTTAFNNGVGIQNAIDFARDNGYTGIKLPKNIYTLTYHKYTLYDDYTRGIIYLRSNQELNLGYSTIEMIFDSTQRSPYHTYESDPWRLSGWVFVTQECHDAKICNGEIKGDIYLRSFTDSASGWNRELGQENTSGIYIFAKSHNILIENLDIHGFMGDSISMTTRGASSTITYFITPTGNLLTGYIKDDGTIISAPGAFYSENIIQIDREMLKTKSPLNPNTLQLQTGGGYTRIPDFKDHYLEIAFL